MTIFRKRIPRGHWAPSALLCSLWRKLLQLGRNDKQMTILETGAASHRMRATIKSLDRMCKPDFPALQNIPLDCQSRQLCHPYVLLCHRNCDSVCPQISSLKQLLWARGEFSLSSLALSHNVYICPLWSSSSYFLNTESWKGLLFLPPALWFCKSSHAKCLL